MTTLPCMLPPDVLPVHKVKFSKNLLNRSSDAYTITVMFMVFKTVERNPDITLNQLRWILNTEFFIHESAVDGAVAALSNKNLYNALIRWTPRKSRIPRLKVKEDSRYAIDAIECNPELQIFEAPVFVPKERTAKETQN